MRKALDIITIVTGILMLGILGGGFVTYRYVKSPEFERTIKNKLMGDLQKKLPDVMKNTLPKTTGESFAIPKKIGL